jgi:hypothetical protein
MTTSSIRSRTSRVCSPSQSRTHPPVRPGASPSSVGCHIVIWAVDPCTIPSSTFGRNRAVPEWAGAIPAAPSRFVDMSELAVRARTLLDLHTSTDILVLANVWDVVSARTVAATPGVKALATASHSIAATFGYDDGENIPLDLHLDMVARIVAAVNLPVSMDLEAGYGDAGSTARRAIDAGVVGGNLEDQMKPLDQAVAAVEAVLAAGRDAGIDFVLNARTDAVVRAGNAPRAQVLEEAVRRGQAYLAERRWSSYRGWSTRTRSAPWRRRSGRRS